MTKNQTVFTTDAALRKMRLPASGRTVWKYAHCRGLTLHVSHTGTRVWYGVVRNHLGRAERCKLGHYLPGSEDGMPLKQAVEIVENARGRARAGLSPWSEFKGEAESLFKAARQRFMDTYGKANWKPSTAGAYRQALFSGALKDWEDKKVADIRKKDVLAVLDRMEARGALVGANRMLAYLKSFFGWCASKNLIPEGVALPTDRVSKPLKEEKPRDRVLTMPELAAVWRATEHIDFPFRYIVRLLILTGQRIGEVCAMAYKDIDTDGRLWTMKENKASRPHLVPLSPQAIEVIRATPQNHMLNKTMLFSTTGTTPPSGYTRVKNNLKAALPDDMAPWTYHDLRRSFGTHLEAAGVLPNVVSALLNHARKGVTGKVYSRVDLLPPEELKIHRMKIQAVEDWGNKIAAHVAADNVVDLGVTA